VPHECSKSSERLSLHATFSVSPWDGAYSRVSPNEQHLAAKQESMDLPSRSKAMMVGCSRLDNVETEVTFSLRRDQKSIPNGV